MPVATGGMTVFGDLGFGYLWSGCTLLQTRGRGAYSAVLAARIERARELGLCHVGLYAITDTSAPIVARQGFKRVGTMTYWERPVST
jgi:N-acetylglutamate synthase-like GNAT family acetyltransferase